MSESESAGPLLSPEEQRKLIAAIREKGVLHALGATHGPTIVTLATPLLSHCLLENQGEVLRKHGEILKEQHDAFKEQNELVEKSLEASEKSARYARISAAIAIGLMVFSLVASIVISCISIRSSHQWETRQIDRMDNIYNRMPTTQPSK